MIKSITAKQMVQAYNKTNKTKEREVALAFCQEISKIIEDKAKKGETSCTVCIPDYIKIEYVAEILRENGYNIAYSSCLTIQW